MVQHTGELRVELMTTWTSRCCLVLGLLLAATSIAVWVVWYAGLAFGLAAIAVGLPLARDPDSASMGRLVLALGGAGIVASAVVVVFLTPVSTSGGPHVPSGSATPMP